MSVAWGSWRASWLAPEAYVIYVRTQLQRSSRLL